jgi:hypothetical protein
MHETTDREQRIAERGKYRRAGNGLLRFLFWSLLFGIAYTQPLLYYSNQNQYFLHGLAHADRGFLNEDWLANTADPTPVFSALVAITFRYLHESLFYIYFIFLLGIYCQALTGIFEHLSGGRGTALNRLGFLALLVALHSALLRWTSAQLFGVDYPWYFQTGVANQYLLGAGLQPSVFGVLLVLSVSTFLQDRPLRAVTWSSLAAVMHSTYLLSAAFLTLAYLYLLLRAGRIRTALLAGLWALLLVSPVLIYNLLAFAPSSPQTFAESQQLLAHFRIPHHAEVDRWLDSIAWGQIGWIVAAAFLVRGSSLFVVMSGCFVPALALTFVQIATGNDMLALLFPWRVSSILVPIATAIILTRIIHCLSRWFSSASSWREGTARAAFAAMLALSVAGGFFITYFGLGYRTNSEELYLLEYIRDHKSEGEIYLLPVELPKLVSGKRGSATLSFLPPPRRSSQEKNISVDLQQFRLFTGAPIYVDFKSIPYKDVEVLEWHERLMWNHQLYEQRDWNVERIVSELRRRRITHVVTTADREVRCRALQLAYTDKQYRLYRLRFPWVPSGPGD